MTPLPLRVLYANHSFNLAVNQARLRAVADGVQSLHGLAPDRWRHELLGMRGSDPVQPGAPYQLHLLPWLGLANPTRFMYRPGPLAELRRSLRPDLLHVEQELYSLAALQLVTGFWRSGIPIVASVHENTPSKLPRGALLLARLLSRRLAAIIYVSEEVRQAWQPRLAPHRSGVVGQGVNLQLFRPPACLPEGPRAPFTVGYFGRLVPEKGVLTLVRALSLLGPHFRLRLSDFGEGKPAVMEEVQHLELGNRVELVRALHEEVPGEMHRLDCLVLPSHATERWSEQFGRVLIEAMACGIPVVATATGSIPSVVGSAGVLVPERDEQALAGAIRNLAADAPRWRELRERGLVRAHEFGWAEIGSQIAAIYGEVINSPSVS